MTNYIATPYTMTREYFQQTYGRGVGAASDYEARQAVDLEAESAMDAASLVWGIFQNLSDVLLTPDGGRSLMVGDLIQLRDGENVHWLRIDAMGFSEISGL